MRNSKKKLLSYYIHKYNLKSQFQDIVECFLINCYYITAYRNKVAYRECLFLLIELRKKVKVKSLSRVQLFGTPWTVAHQAPPPMGFPRQEYWIGLPFPSPGDLPDPGVKPGSPSSCDAGGLFHI